MADFVMEIGGRPGQVHSLFDSTRDYCRKYLTDKAPVFTISVTREDLAFQQRQLDEEADREGMKRRVFSDPFLERAAIQQAFAEALFDSGILMLHGSTVALDGEGYLFTAKCGTGKSTHTRLWREVFGSRAMMVNDDKPFLVPGDPVMICGSPWSGKHGLDSNITVPLKGICILNRGPENRIQRITPPEGLDMLRHQSYCPLDSSKEAIFLQLVDKLAQSVPLWEMHCNKDPEAAKLAQEAMQNSRIFRGDYPSPAGAE